MDISSRLSQYGRLALNKTIIGNKENKEKEQAPEKNQEGNDGESVFNAPTVEADALTLLAMQNRALMNIEKVIQTGKDGGNVEGDTETPKTPEEPTTPPTVNAPSFAPDVSGSDPLKAFEERIAGDEFDKDVSKNEALDVINEYTELLVSDLKSKYNMSDEFLNEVIKFALSELNLQDNGTYNLKNLLISVKSDAEALTGKTIYQDKKWENWINNFSDKEFTEEYLNNNMNCIDFLTPKSWNYFQYNGNENTPAYLKQQHFLDNLYSSARQALGIGWDMQTGYDKFYQMIVDEIANKLGMSSDTITPKDIMEKLDSNGNGSWIDEITDIVNQIEKTPIPEEDNLPEDIANLITAIFKEKDELTAKDLADNLENIDNSDDIEFYNRLDNILLDVMGSMVNDMYFDKVEMLNSILRELNNTLGIQNTEPPVLTKEVFKKFNNVYEFYNKLKQVSLSENVQNDYNFGSVDNKIGEYGQGKTGDCWLLAGINSLNASEVGRELLSKVITKNDDGSYTVTFGGLDKKSYTFSKTDLENAKSQKMMYSYGDSDVILIEMAMEQLFKDLNSGDFVDPKNILPTNKNNLEGGNSNWLIYALTGNVSDIYETDILLLDGIVYDILETAQQELQNGKAGICLTYNINIDPEKDVVGPHHGKMINGMEFINGHVYTIVDISIGEPNDPANNTVTIVNPWDSTKTCTITWAELNQLGVGKIELHNIDSENMPKLSDENIIKNIINTFCSAKNPCASNMQNILEKISSVTNINYSSQPLFNNEGFCGSIHTIEFDYNGKHYTLTQNSPRYEEDREGLNELYDSKQINKYTMDQNIISKYFESAVTIDGKTTTYRLKDGVTFAQFKREARGLKSIHNGRISGVTVTIKDRIEVVGEKTTTIMKDSNPVLSDVSGTNDAPAMSNDLQNFDFENLYNDDRFNISQTINALFSDYHYGEKAKDVFEVYYNKLYEAGLSDDEIGNLFSNICKTTSRQGLDRETALSFATKLEQNIKKLDSGISIVDGSFTKEEIQILGSFADVYGDGLSDEEFENLVKSGILVKDGDAYKMNRNLESFNYLNATVGITTLLSDLTTNRYKLWIGVEEGNSTQDELVNAGWLVGPVNGKYLPNYNIPTINNYVNCDYLNDGIPNMDVISKLYQNHDFIDSTIDYIKTSKTYQENVVKLAGDKEKGIIMNLFEVFTGKNIDIQLNAICELCKKYGFEFGEYSRSAGNYTFTLIAPNGESVELQFPDNQTVTNFLNWTNLGK